MTYLIIINALGFVLMSLDKLLAKLRRRRIPEAMLLGVAAAGGSLGSTVAMYLARHKTRHAKFRFGLPLLTALHVALLLLLFYFVFTAKEI